MNSASIETLEKRLVFAAVSAVAMLVGESCAPVEGKSTSDTVVTTAAARVTGRLTAEAISPIEIKLTYRPATLATLEGKVDSGATSAPLVIERSSAGGAYVAVGTLATGTNTFTDAGLSSNTNFAYRIRQSGVGSPVAAASIKTQKYDAGLLQSFRSPAAVTGTTRSILSYGATANNSSNDDATAIKNAIAASSSGDEIYIPNGVYHIKARDIKLKTGVSLRGQSMTGAVLSAVFTDQGVDNPNSQVLRAEAGVNNLTISNLRIEMSGGQTLQTGIALGSGSEGVSNARRIAIKNCNIEGFERFAVAVRNCDNILVQDCLFRYATALGGGGRGMG